MLKQNSSTSNIAQVRSTSFV